MFRNHLFLLIFIGVLTCVSLSCNKNNEINLQLTIIPSDLFLEYQTGDIIGFDITITSDINIKNLTVVANYPTSKPVKLLDTALFGKSFHFKYFYTVTSARDILLEFTVTDEDGNSSRSQRNVSAYSLLTETTGHKLYSLYSGKQCAYDLIKGEPLFASADSLTKDIQDNSNDTISTKNLSNIWISPSKCSFVIYNGFDYPNASSLKAEQAYISGTKGNEIHNIKNGDIIIAEITRNNTIKQYVVIQITTVNDEPGVKNDYYLFNIKK